MNEEHRKELEELHAYFLTAKFPEVPFPLNKYIVVTGNPLTILQKAFNDIEGYKGKDEGRDSLFAHLRQMKAICEELKAKA